VSVVAEAGEPAARLAGAVTDAAGATLGCAAAKEEIKSQQAKAAQQK